MNTILQSLGIQSINSGICLGPNQWLMSEGQSTVDSKSPANGEVIASVKTCSMNEYEQLMQHSENIKSEWAMTPAPVRGEVVRRIGELLREHKDALGSLVSLEMGKIKAEGDGEVQEMIDMADYAVGLSRMFSGQTLASERPKHRLMEQWHPLGLVGVISAFNFPVAVWAWNAFIAAVCGNITIWKPARKVPLTAIAVQNICNQAMADNNLTGIFSLFIPDSRDISEAFIADTRIPLVSFTGSTEVGYHVHEVVSKRLGKTILEMSGNNAIIVDETADLDLALPGIVFGAVGTAGQRCTTTRRLYLHESIYDTMLERIRHAYEQVKLGDPLDSTTLMGPLIDEGAVKDYEDTIQEIKNLNGEIIYGGQRIEGSGSFVTPTLVKAEADWPVLQEETFAPILYVVKYSVFDDAIHMQNNVRQGLSSALFSNNMRRIEQFLSAVGSDCGIANINIGTSGAEIGGAFGGEKETGGGREAGSDSWKVYMRRQTNTINWGSELPLAQGIKFDIG